MTEPTNDLRNIRIGISEILSLLQNVSDNVAEGHSRVKRSLAIEEERRLVEHEAWMKKVRAETKESKLRLTSQRLDVESLIKYLDSRRETEAAKLAAAQAEAAYWQRRQV